MLLCLQLRKEKDDLQKSIEVIYHDAETQLSERDQKWQEIVDKTKAHYDELSRQHRETYKKYYVQKYLKWCKAMLGEGQEGVVPPVKSGEEATLHIISENRVTEAFIIPPSYAPAGSAIYI